MKSTCDRADRGLDELLAASLDGDAVTTRRLVDRLVPVVWSRVTRVARLGRRRTAEQVNQLGEDLMQEVFAQLFRDDARLLRAWSPERGLSLEGYVGLVATNHAASVLRSGRRGAWREDATDDDELARAAGASPSPSARIDARDTLEHLGERLRAELSPLGVRMFELLVVEERSTAEICAMLCMNADALYAWRSRLTKTVARVAAALDDARACHPFDAHDRMSEKHG